MPKCFLLKITLGKQDNIRETLIRKISELWNMLGTDFFLAVGPFKVNPLVISINLDYINWLYLIPE